MAALTTPIVGNGTTISWNSLTLLVRKISGLDNRLPIFKTSDLSTTEYETYKKDTLMEPGKVTVEVYWTGVAIAPGVVGTATITWPSAGSFSGTAISTMTKYPDAENGAALVGSFELSFDGYTGPAFTAA